MAATAAVTGCSGVGPPNAGCTEIGAVPGVAVLVKRDVSGTDDPALDLTICQTGCGTYRVSLRPGATTVAEPCDSADSDGTCSGSTSPDGTYVGFVGVADLGAGDVRISGRFGDREHTRQLAEVTVRAEVTHPNGPQCPPGGVQAQVRLTTAGLR
ncbi:MAG: hypothetical protein L0H24_12210 [Microlunatus sp.]|nr:hypothetical protein [Microlunatus sp.]